MKNVFICVLTLLTTTSFAQSVKKLPAKPIKKDSVIIEKIYTTRTVVKEHPMLKKPAPLFTAKTITGQSINLAELKRKVVLINFWYMGNTASIVGIPTLNKIYTNYKNKNFVFVSMSISSPEQLKKFTQTKDSTEIFKTLKRVYTENQIPYKKLPNERVKYPIIPSCKDFAHSYKTSIFPTTFLIDKKGVIRAVYDSPFALPEDHKDEYYENLTKEIDKLLKE